MRLQDVPHYHNLALLFVLLQEKPLVTQTRDQSICSLLAAQHPRTRVCLPLFVCLTLTRFMLLQDGLCASDVTIFGSLVACLL